MRCTLQFRRLPPVARRNGFTLVEVILAISIAIGLLMVALYFYGQTADLRARLLDETDRVASIRLYLDQMTRDLRACFAQPQTGFTGGLDSLRFVLAGLPAAVMNRPGSWTHPGAGGADLHLVTYGVTRGVEGTNIVMTGITRTESSLADAPAVSASTNSPASGPGTSATTGPGPNVRPWIDTIHFVLLTYWDGTGWASSWDAPQPPACVEVSVGSEPLPEGTDPLDYPYELFRRVIYVPASRGTEDDLDLFSALGASGTPGLSK